MMLGSFFHKKRTETPIQRSEPSFLNPIFSNVRSLNFRFNIHTAARYSPQTQRPVPCKRGAEIMKSFTHWMNRGLVLAFSLIIGMGSDFAQADLAKEIRFNIA